MPIEPSSCPRCGGVRTGRSRTSTTARICWDCGASFEPSARRGLPAAVRARPRERLASTLPSRRVMLLFVAVVIATMLALVALYAVGFFDWVRCSIDSTASC
jgi:hypothetical protein